jgi:hypothetical protein
MGIMDTQIENMCFSHFWSFLVIGGWLWWPMGYLFVVMGMNGSIDHVMWWLEIFFMDYGHKSRKYVFQPFLIIFGHRWVAVVACGVFV